MFAGVFLLTSYDQSDLQLTTYDLTHHTMSQTDDIRYLALGDSYTIGESVAAQQTFPFLLAGELKVKNKLDVKPTVIARTGWTTGELQAAIDKAQPTANYDLVTLLIGVNNQYRGMSLKQYEREFTLLLNNAIVCAQGKKENVIVLSIPDYGCTPYGAASKERIGREIDDFNRVNKRVAIKKGVHYVDITPISRLAAEKPSLVAGDGLHPSGEMYRLWVELLIPEVQHALNIE
ncbi:MAG: GDSL-like Lipase/Acylhydrolase [Cytophagaceae bacterium]|nr:GDSL-like Lipase/Acylhydrolase [Cytophagaceae bacterium]